MLGPFRTWNIPKLRTLLPMGLRFSLEEILVSRPFFPWRNIRTLTLRNRFALLDSGAYKPPPTLRRNTSRLELGPLDRLRLERRRRKGTRQLPTRGIFGLVVRPNVWKHRGIRTTAREVTRLTFGGRKRRIGPGFGPIRSVTPPLFGDGSLPFRRVGSRRTTLPRIILISPLRLLAFLLLTSRRNPIGTSLWSFVFRASPPRIALEKFRIVPTPCCITIKRGGRTLVKPLRTGRKISPLR